eukprot:COSAG06_NODE_31253_length_524_cov_1.397647_1_plen_88_part_01
MTFFDRTGAVINRSGSPAVRHTNASVSCPASLRIHTHTNSTQSTCISATRQWVVCSIPCMEAEGGGGESDDSEGGGGGGGTGPCLFEA